MTRRGTPSGSRPALIAGLLAAALSAALICGAVIAQEKKASPAQKSGAAKSAKADKSAKAKSTKAGTAKSAKGKAAKGKAKGTAKSGAKSGKGKSSKKAAAGPDDKLIEPFIAENTFIVARLDVQRADLDAIEKYVTQTVDAAGGALAGGAAGQGEQMKAAAAEGLKVARESREKFTAAGGRHVYVLLDGESAEWVVIVPLAKGADAKALTAVLDGLDAKDQHVVAEVAGALVSTNRSKMTGLRIRAEAVAGGAQRGAGAQRPHLPDAFAAAGDAPLRIAYVPGHMARLIVEHLQDLPQGLGSDTELLSRGVRWFTIAVGRRMDVTVQANNAENAAKLSDLIGKGVASLGAEATADEEAKANRAKLLESLKPKQQEDRITVTLDWSLLQKGVPPAALMTTYEVARFIATEGKVRFAGDPVSGGSTPSPTNPPPSSGAAPSPSAVPVAADDKLILPYVGPNTFLVGRFDVARVDAAALERFVNESIAAAGTTLSVTAEELAQMKAGVAEGFKVMREGLGTFAAAGGQHVYVVWDSEHAALGAVLVTPLREGANAARLTELLQSQPSPQQATSEVGKALLTGNPIVIEAVRKRFAAATAAGGKPPAERPDLTAAFAAAGDAPFRLALIPGEAARKLLAEASLPPLPPQFGGGDPAAIARGVRWLTLAAHQKPAVAITLTIEAADAASATRLTDLLKKAIEQAKAQPLIDPDAEAKRAQNLAALAPKQQGNTITITVGASLIQPGIPEAVRAALRMREAIKAQQPPAAAQPPGDSDGLD